MGEERHWEVSVQNKLCRRPLTIRLAILRGNIVPQYQKKERRDISATRNGGSRLPVCFQVSLTGFWVRRALVW